MVTLKEAIETTKQIVALTPEDRQRLAKHINGENAALSKLAKAIMNTIKKDEES